MGVKLGHGLWVAAALALGACAPREAEPPPELDPMSVIEESGLNDIMLQFADPAMAVQHFRNLLERSPNNVEYRRGLAISLVRARRHTEAVLIYEQLVERNQASNADRIALANAYLRNNGWAEARATLDSIPPTYETYDRYRLEAMLADNAQEWDRADNFYDIARGLTTSPANILNNWGYSKRIRGDLAGAERLFRQALSHDSTLFTAKSNLVAVRALQGTYRLPIIPMTDTEKAELLYEVAIVAYDRGDVDIARGLLEEAIDTHPQYFENAVQALESLRAGGVLR